VSIFKKKKKTFIPQKCIKLFKSENSRWKEKYSSLPAETRVRVRGFGWNAWLLQYLVLCFCYAMPCASLKCHFGLCNEEVLRVIYKKPCHHCAL